MHPKSLFYTILLTFVVLFVGCKDDDTPEPGIPTSINLTSKAFATDKAVVYDSVQYTNAEGNVYSVTRLQFYLSKFQFHHIQKGWQNTDVDIYFDLKLNLLNPSQIKNIPIGSYDSLRFIFGLPEDKNRTGALPNSMENVNMAWPDPMGGGYHFLKFEGRYRDKVDVIKGFAMHIGTIECKRTITIPASFEIMAGEQNMDIVVDLNTILNDPNKFDFNEHYYTMGIDSLMVQLSDNMYNAFNIEFK